MLIALMPNQCQSNWDLIKDTISKVGLFEHPREEYYTNILEQLATCKMHAWIGTNVDNAIIGLVLTKIVPSDIENTNHLLIFCLAGFDEVGQDVWQDGFGTLAKFAKVNKCSSIVAYTKHEGIVRIAERFGANKYHYVKMEV